MSSRHWVICWAALAWSVPSTVSAQGRDWRVALGPTFSDVGSNRSWGTTPYPLTGAGSQGYHAAVMLARPIGGSAADLRAELLYNRFVDTPNTYQAIDGSSLARVALRDETIAATLSTAFLARRGKNWSPYLIAGLGMYHSRLGTNPEPNERRVTQTFTSVNLGVSYGAGLELTLWRSRFFVEARQHRMSGQERGTQFLPVSFGLRF